MPFYISSKSLDVSTNKQDKNAHMARYIYMSLGNRPMSAASVAAEVEGETKRNVFVSDDVKRVWRQPGEEYKDKCD